MLYWKLSELYYVQNKSQRWGGGFQISMEVVDVNQYKNGDEVKIKSP